MIIRNPYYVFTSLAARSMVPKQTQENVTLAKYERAAKVFCEAMEKADARLFCIKYEDCFGPQLRNMLQSIFSFPIKQTKTKYSRQIICALSKVRLRSVNPMKQIIYDCNNVL